MRAFRARNDQRLNPFSSIRTVTVGFGFAPNLLTPIVGTGRSRASNSGACAGLRYRRWGLPPRPENECSGALMHRCNAIDKPVAEKTKGRENPAFQKSDLNTA